MLGDTTVRMWLHFMGTVVFLPRENLQLGSPMTEPGSNKSIIRKKNKDKSASIK